MITFDKVWWSFRALVFIGLLWFKFVEDHVPLWGALIVWAGVVAFIFSRGRKKE